MRWRRRSRQWRGIVPVALALTTGCLVNRYENLGITDSSARASLVGSTIVFSRNDGVYLAHGDGSSAVRVVSCGEIGKGGAVFMPAIDPGGRKILFLSVEDLEVRESTGRNLSLNIITFDAPAAPGSGISSWRKVLLEKVAPPGPGGRQEIFGVAGAAWSRDGKRLALGLNREQPAGGDAILTFDADGTPLEEYSLGGKDLARFSALSWTKQDTGIIFGLEGQDDAPGIVGRLDLVSSGGARQSARVVELGPGRFPALSPDGDRIAVVDEGSGAGDLVLLGVDGKELARYERPAGRAPNRPFWSADGRYLYYYSLAATGPLGLVDVTILRCLDIRTQQVFDLIRLG
ncbi:MAG TPA: hypothetical protein VFE84_00660 [Patescibacteria group bacterium]|nr:hypothetical protein [Patescibacteria group bacterium]